VTTDLNGFFSLDVGERSDFWELRVLADGFVPWSGRVTIYLRERLDIELRPDPRAGASTGSAESRERREARKTMHDGLAAARDGRREEEIATLRQAIAIDPTYAAAHNNLGVQFRMAGDLAAAEESLRRAAELDPLAYHAHLNLGALLLDTDRPQEAVPQLRDALLIDPTAAPAAALLGRAYLQLRLAQQALDQLEDAQRLSGGQLDLGLEISDAHILRGDLAAALTAKEEWLRRHGDDARAERVRATIATLRERLAVKAPPPPG
jgi:tetratricopeptide (TPR) repeat protein